MQARPSLLPPPRLTEDNQHATIYVHEGEEARRVFQMPCTHELSRLGLPYTQEKQAGKSRPFDCPHAQSMASLLPTLADSRRMTWPSSSAWTMTCPTAWPGTQRIAVGIGRDEQHPLSLQGDACVNFCLACSAFCFDWGGFSWLGGRIGWALQAQGRAFDEPHPRDPRWIVHSGLTGRGGPG